jgi:hypothetical protein
LKNRVFFSGQAGCGLRVARVTGPRVFWAHGSRVQAPGFRRSSSIAGFPSQSPIMEDRVLTGRGSRVLRVSGSLSPALSLVHGLTGDRVAGVLWSRRRHPSEDRTPSPSTLPISSLSQQLSALTSLGLISLFLSSLSLSDSLCLTVFVREKEERRRRKKKKDE